MDQGSCNRDSYYTACINALLSMIVVHKDPDPLHYGNFDVLEKISLSEFQRNLDLVCGPDATDAKKLMILERLYLCYRADMMPSDDIYSWVGVCHDQQAKRISEMVYYSIDRILCRACNYQLSRVVFNYCLADDGLEWKRLEDHEIRRLSYDDEGVYSVWQIFGVRASQAVWATTKRIRGFLARYDAMLHFYNVLEAPEQLELAEKQMDRSLEPDQESIDPVFASALQVTRLFLDLCVPKAVECCEKIGNFPTPEAFKQLANIFSSEYRALLFVTIVGDAKGMDVIRLKETLRSCSPPDKEASELQKIFASINLNGSEEESSTDFITYYLSGTSSTASSSSSGSDLEDSTVPRLNSCSDTWINYHV